MVTRNAVHLSQLDVSVTQLEILTVNLGINPSFGSIRAALVFLALYVSEDVRIARPGSPYDCTGRPFTQWIKLLSRTIHPEDNGYKLVFIFMHNIALDI